MIIMDSSVLIDVLRQRERAVGVVDAALAADDQDVTASVVTKTEMLAGMRSHERRRTRDLFETIDWLPVTEADAELAGEFARLYRRSHVGIDIPDYLIAATAHRRDADLWTKNTKHFPMFEDLVPPY